MSARVRPVTVAEAAKKGHLDGLRAMRDKLAVDMDAAEPAVVAQISGRLQAVMDRIAELERLAPAEVSKVDELAAKRRKAGGAASDSVSSSGRRRNVRRS
jgi:hypothetical protein